MVQVRVQIQQAALDATIRKLQSLPGRIGRRALRIGVEKAGSMTLSQAKSAAPRGRTGQFKRSLAKKDLRDASKGMYTALVGQNRSKSGTARQIAAANRRTGRVSKGLSGQGFAPAIHWLNSGTKPHAIRAKNKRLMVWNIGANRAVLNPARAAVAVKHPGHAGTGFLTNVETRYRAQRLRTIRREAEAECRRLGY